MYLISVYFDEKTNRRIQGYIDQAAEKSGNRFMIDGKVPPHITISAFETIYEEEAVRILKEKAEEFEQGEITWCSVGTFLPYVIYIAPVLNEYLQNMMENVFASISKIDNIRISPFYRPLQWMPHTTIGKKLSEEEMMTAFRVLQGQFGVFSGQVAKIGLARTNPYEDLICLEL